MRNYWCCLVLTIAVLMPNVGKAQVFQFRTPPPDVSAAGAVWQMSSEPIVVSGLTYYPTRSFRLFDGQVMSQTGMFEGVPVYADTTLEPYMEIYVPVGSGRMRAYERRRERELAGTTGSHVPAFPVDSPSALPAPDRVVDMSAIGGVGRLVANAFQDQLTMPPPRPRHTSIVTGVPLTGGPNGVWLEFDGARWYSDGKAMPFSADRFERVGEYQGFPVYRDKTSGGGDVWIAVVKDGPLAPYAKR
jgi:hypothetical protein